MTRNNSLGLCLCTFLVITLLAVVVNCYNDDRQIVKWSPLWFNSYLRRGVLHKRFNDDMPIYKWSPLFFERSNPYRYFLKRSSTCLPEWAECRQEDTPCCTGKCFEGFCLGASSLDE